MKPDYLIIGAMKSGTTSADFYMNQHPKIYCNYGEIHFFDNNDNFKNGKKWYESKFKENMINGEKTPYYCFHKKSLQRIKKYYPNIKLILFIRDPIFRAYSQYNHAIQAFPDNKYLGINPKISFRKAIDNDLKRKKIQVRKTILQRGFYIDQIEYILQLFPRKNLKIIVSEWYLKDPLKWNNEIYTFLGTFKLNKIKPEIQHKRKYTIGKIKEKDIKYLKKIYKPYNKKLFKFLGYNINEWL